MTRSRKKQRMRQARYKRPKTIKKMRRSKMGSFLAEQNNNWKSEQKIILPPTFPILDDVLHVVFNYVD